MRLLFKITSRERPQKFLTTLRSIVDNLSVGSDHLILVSIDEDDPKKEEYLEGWKALDNEKELPEGAIRCGQSDNKVFAINRDLKQALAMEWDILVNVSDDQVFIKKGFDKDIIAAFELHSEGAVTQYDLDKLIHFPDGYVNERLVTMAIMGRPYYQTFGYIYHPAYVSLFCDNEQMEVAQKAGKYKYINTHLFKHEHPANVAGLPVDDLLRYTQSFYVIDQKTYNHRKSLGFPKEYLHAD